MTVDFMRGLQEDLRREESLRTKGMGETLTNYINRAELSHMESPEADQKFMEKFGGQVDDFFSSISLPADPMQAALARSPEELEEEAAADILREAVREAYLRKLDGKKAEELRLRRAMKRLEEKGYEAPSEEARRWEPALSAGVDAAKVRAAIAQVEQRREAEARGEGGTSGYHPPAARRMAPQRQESTFEEEMEALADGLDEGALLEELEAMQQKMKMMQAMLGSKRKKRSNPSNDSGTSE